MQRCRIPPGWWLTSAVVASLAGCATPEPVVVECKWPRPAAPAGDALVAQNYDAMTPIPLNALQFTSAALARQVVVQQLSARRTPTNTVQVTGRLVNCTDEPLVVASRLHFMDAKQIPVEDSSVWQRIVLHPRALGQWQTQSTSADAHHYVVELRAEGDNPSPGPR